MSDTRETSSRKLVGEQVRTHLISRSPYGSSFSELDNHATPKLVSSSMSNASCTVVAYDAYLCSSVNV